MNLDGSSTLCDRLAKVLPEGSRFTIHHLSTPPTRCPSLYAAPPGELAEETHCESHFLSVAINKDGDLLQIFGIEVLIFTTEFLTTIFVSKADSTGYLCLLGLPTGTPSPLKTISTTFLRFLIQERRRSDRRLVLSLFARAQNQYLFPGSVDNSHKHVLDDRGLIKWWCKVVDPLFEVPKDSGATLVDDGEAGGQEGNARSYGYLRVPGCDRYETKAFLPQVERGRNPCCSRWHTTDPLSRLGRSPDLPERCLIPRLPDDPKARFVEQLDEELPNEDAKSPPGPSQDRSQIPASHDKGRWRSVRSMEQFWDMMSYRQECSSGRLVGFMWAIFQPNSLINAEKVVDYEERSRNPAQMASSTPGASQQQEPLPLIPQSPLRSSPALEPASTPRQNAPGSSPATPEPSPQKTRDVTISNQPTETKYYYWPESSRGEVILRQKDYQRIGNLLVRLDYENQSLAVESTRKWIAGVAEKAGVANWGHEILGTAPIIASTDVRYRETDPTMLSGKGPAVLSAGLIRKKKRPYDDLNGHQPDEKVSDTHVPEVSPLANGLVRKKAKVVQVAETLPTG